MFPDIVSLADLKQSSLQQSNSYTVGTVQSVIAGLTRTGEWVGKFDGLNALFDYQRQYQPKPHHGMASDRARKRDSFHFFNDFEEAITVYRETPAQVVNFKQSDVIIEGGESSGKQLVYDVTGDMLDIGRFLTGEPEVFGSLTNGNPRNKRVTILLALSWWSKVPQTVINERSSQVVRLVDWLESQSIRTQVIGVNSNGCCHLELVVKPFDEPLNLNDIGVVSHSDFLRRVIFRITEHSETYTMGYGDSKQLGDHWSAHQKDYASDYNDEYTMLIDGGMTDEAGAVKGAFQRLELELLKALEDDEPSKVFKVL